MLPTKPLPRPQRQPQKARARKRLRNSAGNAWHCSNWQTSVGTIPRQDKHFWKQQRWTPWTSGRQIRGNHVQQRSVGAAQAPMSTGGHGKEEKSKPWSTRSTRRLYSRARRQERGRQRRSPLQFQFRVPPRNRAKRRRRRRKRRRRNCLSDPRRRTTAPGQAWLPRRRPSFSNDLQRSRLHPKPRRGPPRASKTDQQGTNLPGTIRARMSSTIPESQNLHQGPWKQKEVEIARKPNWTPQSKLSQNRGAKQNEQPRPPKRAARGRRLRARRRDRERTTRQARVPRNNKWNPAEPAPSYLPRGNHLPRQPRREAFQRRTRMQCSPWSHCHCQQPRKRRGRRPRRKGRPVRTFPSRSGAKKVSTQIRIYCWTLLWSITTQIPGSSGRVRYLEPNSTRWGEISQGCMLLHGWPVERWWFTSWLQDPASKALRATKAHQWNALWSGQGTRSQKRRTEEAPISEQVSTLSSSTQKRSKRRWQKRLQRTRRPSSKWHGRLDLARTSWMFGERTERWLAIFPN